MDEPQNADSAAPAASPAPASTEQKPKPRRGRPPRPSTYNLEIATEICERIGNAESMREICADPDMPAAATVYRWLITIPDFQLAYRCALLAKFDARSEEIIAIADNAADDYKTELDANGVPVMKTNPELLRRTELKIETRKWQAARELPRKYGDLLALPPPTDGAFSAPADDKPPAKAIEPPSEDPLKDAIEHWRGLAQEQPK
jgi:hypothetical protein